MSLHCGVPNNVSARLTQRGVAIAALPAHRPVGGQHPLVAAAQAAAVVAQDLRGRALGAVPSTPATTTQAGRVAPPAVERVALR